MIGCLPVRNANRIRFRVQDLINDDNDAVVDMKSIIEKYKSS